MEKLDLDRLSAHFVDFLTGKFPYSSELQSFWMAFQGVMIVRNGPNKDGHMAWFHAFMLSVICGYGGAAFGFIWMGKPSSMLSNDLNVASCILTFLFVNYLPFNLGNKIGSFFPVVFVTTVFAQLFRTMGLVKFVGAAFEDLKHNPSRYYPIPVFGPILYGTLLGNMSSFFLKGFHEYLANGMPWPFQNGIFCATFYHFYANDTTGPIGNALRNFVHGSIPSIQGGLDDRTFATAAVSLFMQIVGILHMPIFLGPHFSPFTLMGSVVYRSTQLVTFFRRPKVAAESSAARGGTAINAKVDTAAAATKRKKSKKDGSAELNGSASDAPAVEKVDSAAASKRKRSKKKGGDDPKLNGKSKKE